MVRKACWGLKAASGSDPDIKKGRRYLHRPLLRITHTTYTIHREDYLHSDIFDFWKCIGPTDHIHPADDPVFKRLGEDGHGFNTRCLPSAFMGPLKTAQVVLLYMSPGYNPEDEKNAISDEGQQTYAERRGGNQPLPDKNKPGGNWWRERTKCFKVDDDIIAKKTAVLNIGAYHSEEMKNHALLAALPSSRVSLDWAQNILFPEAEAGRRVVICLRAAKFWGLTTGKEYKGTLFAPPVTRGGHMIKGSYRETVIQAAQSALNN